MRRKSFYEKESFLGKEPFFAGHSSDSGTERSAKEEAPSKRTFRTRRGSSFIGRGFDYGKGHKKEVLLRKGTSMSHFGSSRHLGSRFGSVEPKGG